ncbi:uncharacterized protein PV06_11112 [Exophiala oligosperma]|uniref:Uncharacterized protein n=1 Tax=Exophiala oligosperma TaxID=215243 RepID=A0A0D2D0A1_9EURO|nr:uncharacterized protein PV06_11112 [Exophiala oligosperma]KIW36703.1 hypothetical protein PV06_11112 [Exophiala oligosperma]
MAVGEAIHTEYKKLDRMVNSTIRAEERALLKCSQRQYDETAPIEAIQRQIKGTSAEGQELAPESDSTQIKIPDRRQIAEAAMSDSAVFTGPKALSRHKMFLNDDRAMLTKGATIDERNIFSYKNRIRG